MAELQDKSIIKHIPNALTIGRLILTTVLLGMILWTPKLELEKPSMYLLLVFIFFVVTALTDIADGAIARRYNVTSKFGRIADPLADKFLVLGAFICLAAVGKPTFGTIALSNLTCHIIRWGVVVIIIAREIFVTVQRHIAEARGIEFGATWSGKLKMFLQSFGIGTVLVKWGFISRPWGDWFTLVTFALLAIVTIYSGIDYSLRKMKH
jgi:CDP-diacylglycerol--glycerol-3-phosphate 3-phosphatidyltransferase